MKCEVSNFPARRMFEFSDRICGTVPDSSTLLSMYHKWIARLEQVIAMNGDYYFKLATKIRSYLTEGAGAGESLLFDTLIRLF
jgi:hypothetical protein